MSIKKLRHPNFLGLDFNIDPSQPPQGAIVLTDNAYEKLVELWILRTLLPLGAHKRMLLSTQIYDDEVIVAVGLGAICKMEKEGRYDRAEALALLSSRYAEAEQNAPRVPARRPLERNLKWLAKRLGLSRVQVEILRFMVFTQECEHLSTALSRLGNLSQQSVFRVLSSLLRIPEKRIAEALSPDEALSSCGLVTLNHNYQGEFGGKLELLSGIIDHLFGIQSNPMMMLRERVVPGKTARLSAGDYPHVTDDIEVLKRYLGKSLGQEGANVLVYGPPGTGKTEFVRMFAKEMGLSLYEVATQEADSTPLNGSRRLRAYRLAQQMMRKEAGALIMFDEIEDIFREGPEEGDNRRGRNAVGKKAWLNQTLENNPVPAFWLSNAIHVIDAAIVRRFDYVLHLETPPRAVRANILKRYFSETAVSQPWIEHLAQHDGLAPAIVERAAKVVSSLDELPKADIERVTTRIINGTLEAMSLAPIQKAVSQANIHYRPECLNTDPPIHEVVDKLARHGQGRLCLFGPPGTGKTAYGRYLADLLERRLIVKRASDILDAYLGETEKRIASMFTEAAEENAVLLLDEADSFLLGREKAVRSWEITQVNEMLTQMEQFDGIFIASTNFMDTLDEATLRRFDLKVRFDWLSPRQIDLLLTDAVSELGIEYDEVWAARVREIQTLTPGDFANVIRQSRLRSMPDTEALYRALFSESKARPRLSRSHRIGF